MPWATWVMLELNNAKDKLGKLQDNWAQCTYNAFTAKWAQVGDKVSADFFKFVTPKKTCNGIKQLQRDDGSITVRFCTIARLVTRRNTFKKLSLISSWDKIS